MVPKKKTVKATKAVKKKEMAKDMKNKKKRWSEKESIKKDRVIISLRLVFKNPKRMTFKLKRKIHSSIPNPITRRLVTLLRMKCCMMLHRDLTVVSSLALVPNQLI